MKKSKISTQLLAEIIVERFDEMKGYTERIEITTSKKLKLDLEEYRNLQENYRILQQEHSKVLTQKLEQEKSILKRFEELNSKNQTRLPNWMLISLLVFYLCLFAVIVYLVYYK
jgi:CRISPR/Cas system-associated endonuclease Cas3-HD